jgi:transposase
MGRAGRCARAAGGGDARRRRPMLDEEIDMSIVMGLDQHRAQITPSGSTLRRARCRVVGSRLRIARVCAGFLARFEGRDLEVALEATTGWRFVVEEIRRVGATAHLAEPAETSALRANKERAKNDRADARHLRELLMAPGASRSPLRSG